MTRMLTIRQYKLEREKINLERQKVVALQKIAEYLEIQADELGEHTRLLDQIDTRISLRS